MVVCAIFQLAPTMFGLYIMHYKDVLYDKYSIEITNIVYRV